MSCVVPLKSGEKNGEVGADVAGGDLVCIKAPVGDPGAYGVGDVAQGGEMEVDKLCMVGGVVQVAAAFRGCNQRRLSAA